MRTIIFKVKEMKILHLFLAMVLFVSTFAGTPISVVLGEELSANALSLNQSQLSDDVFVPESLGITLGSTPGALDVNWQTTTGSAIEVTNPGEIQPIEDMIPAVKVALADDFENASVYGGQSILVYAETEISSNIVAQKVTIENLQPDTTYQYAVSPDGVTYSEWYSYHTLPKQITIFHTNDIHGNNLSSSTVIGDDKIAALKQSVPNAILVDAGDATQGNSFASLTQGKDVIQLMNAAKYDVMAAGNHEFDYGVSVLQSNQALASFPILSANSIKNGQPVLAGTTYDNGKKINNGANVMIDAAGVKVGFFGITTPETAAKANPAGIVGVTFEDAVAVSKAQIQWLKDQGATVIVGIMHLGIDPSSEVTSRNVAQALQGTGLSLIIDGHSHSKMDEQVGDIYIAQTGSGGTAVGKVEIALANGLPTNVSGVLYDANAPEIKALTPNKYITDLAASMKAAQDVLLAPIVGKTQTSLWGGTINGINEARLYETNLGNVIADAMADAAHTLIANNSKYSQVPVVALQNGGGVRTVIKAGNITKGDVINVLPFGNSLEFKEVTPKIVYEALENGVSKVMAQDATTGKITGADGRFPQISGMRFEYDPTKTPGNRVTAVYLDNNKLLDRNDNTTLIVLASNDFEIAGGDGYTMLSGLKSVGGGDTLDVVFENYLTKLTQNQSNGFLYPIYSGRVKTVGAYTPTAYNAKITVKDTSGGALANSYVEYRIDGGNVIGSKTNSDGVLFLAKLPDGPHSVQFVGGNEILVNNYSGVGLDIAISAVAKPGTEPSDKKSSGSSGSGNYGGNTDLSNYFANKPTTETTPPTTGTDNTTNNTINNTTNVNPGTKLPPDLKDALWAQEAITFLVKSGVISAYPDGNFKPNNNVTRAEFATMIVRAFHIQTKQSKAFTDTSPSDWYYEYVTALTSNGLVAGYPDGSFGANQPISREEMATILYRVVLFKNIELKNGGNPEFLDGDQVSSFAAEAVNALAKGKVINGMVDGTFAPKQTATRAQAAKIIYDLLK